MAVELRDFVVDIAVQAVAVADSGLCSLYDLYSAGMPRGVDPGALVVGGTTGGVVGGGAVYGGAPSGTTGSGTDDGTAGGSNVGRDDATRPRVPTSVQARRDAQKVYDASLPGQINRQILNVSEAAQKWAESIIGKDVKGTAPAGSKA